MGSAVLAAVTLTAVAGHGTATDGLKAADDAPISTGRWAEDIAPVELAGGLRTAPVAEVSPPPAPQPIHITVPSPSITQVAFRPRARTEDHQIVFDVGEDDAAEDRALGQAFAVASPQAEPKRLDARRLLVKIGPAPQDRKKGRWFVFAAGSGDAFGLNLIKDPVKGWRRAGWSVERLAEYGKAQLGIGWRRGETQLALSAARREIAAYGVSREDTVVGVTFTVSGKPPAKTRFEQKLPRR